MTENNCKFCKPIGVAFECVCSHNEIREEYIIVSGKQPEDFTPRCPFNDEPARIYCTRYTEKPLERYDVVIISDIAGGAAQHIYSAHSSEEAYAFIKIRIKIMRVEI